MKNSSYYIAPVGVRTHDLPHTAASNMSKVSHALTHSATAPVNLPPIDQTFNICTKLVNAQVGCVTNVDSYSLYACTYVASVRDISTIVYHRQVIFVAVTKLLRFFLKQQIFFLLQVFKKFHIIPRMCAYNYTLLENYPYIPCAPSLSTMWD